MHLKYWGRVRVRVLNATFNNISAILVEETWVLGENHRPIASHWQTLSHNVESSTPHWAGFKITKIVVIGTDCIVYDHNGKILVSKSEDISYIINEKLFNFDWFIISQLEHIFVNNCNVVIEKKIQQPYTMKHKFG